MKTAIYCRVSTQDQTLDTQREACIEYCQRNSLDYELFEEKISGAKASRPQLDLMLQRIRANEFQIVIVHKLDRLGRSMIHLIQLIEEFRNKKVSFIAISQGINTNDAQGRFFLNVMASFAELEREMIRERTRNRFESMKKKGIRLGRPPGSKDKKKRKRSGYWLRYHKEK